MIKKWLLCLIVFIVSLIPSDQYEATYGIIDRIIGNIAIVLVEEKLLQLEINLEKLPNNVREGSIIMLNMSGDEIISMEKCDEKTEIESNKSKFLMERLRKNNKSTFKWSNPRIYEL